MYIVTNCYIMTTLINCSQLRNARPPLLKPRTNERLKMCYLPYNHQDLRSINCTISNRGYIPSVKLHYNSKRRGTSLYFRKPVRLLHPIYITFFSSRESFSFFPSVNSKLFDFCGWMNLQLLSKLLKKMLKRPTVTWRWWFGEGHVFKLCQSQNRLSEKKPICRINY